MKEELKTILTVDYVFIPYEDRTDLILREDRLVYKDMLVSTYKGKKIYSPVSGRIYGLSEINTLNGPVNVLIIENDFKDKVEKRIISVEDIYKLKPDAIKKSFSPTTNTLDVYINDINTYDLKNEYILDEHINKILETLDLIDITYPNLKVNIKLDKRNIKIYQKLFSYIGTYPNIELSFLRPNEGLDGLDLYDIIDLYYELKKSRKRDYIYFTLTYGKNIYVIKTKRYSNLNEILKLFSIESKEIIINRKVKFTNSNILLDDTISTINVI